MGKISDIRGKSRSNSYSLDRRVYAIQGGGRTSLNVNGKGWDIDVSFTLNATDIHGIAYVFDARGNGEGGVSPTITGGHQSSISDYTAIVLEVHGDSHELH